jgi:peroxiredoxin Q/BCP
LRDRVTFVIDRSGIVRHVFTSMIDMQGHVNKALPIVRQLVAGA